MRAIGRLKMTVKGLVASLTVLHASAAFGSGWTEVQYQLGPAVDHLQMLYHFDVYVTGTYTWSVSIQNHFVVAGSTTQAPAWRTRFANLADNAWWESATFSNVPLLRMDRVENWEAYYELSGTNSFSKTDPPDFASRSLSERITEEIYYTIRAGGAAPPPGGP